MAIHKLLAVVNYVFKSINPFTYLLTYLLADFEPNRYNVLCVSEQCKRLMCGEWIGIIVQFRSASVQTVAR